MTSRWGGRRAQRWTAEVLARYGRECALRLPGCTRVATTGDHIKSRKFRPDLQYDVTNGRPSCLSCNQLRGDGSRDESSTIDARGFFESRATSRKDCDLSPPRAPEISGYARFETEGARS